MEYKREDISIYYEIVGRGKPILMLHGFTADHRLVKGCLEPVLRKKPGWKRIYVDLPGMGHSKAPSIKNADDMLDILLEFLTSVVPNGPFALAGESYGTHLSAGIASELPDRVMGLLFICPVVHADSSKRTVPPFTVRKRDAAFMKKLKPEQRKEFEPMAVVQTKKTWERFQKEIMSGLKVHDQEFCNRFYQAGYGLVKHSDTPLRPFEKPVLILAGRQDHVVGYEDSWKLLPLYPHASFVVLDNAGHNLHIEQPVIFNSLVGEWLERMKSEGF